MNNVTRMPSSGAGRLAKSIRGGGSAMVAPLPAALAGTGYRAAVLSPINPSLDVPGADAPGRERATTPHRPHHARRHPPGTGSEHQGGIVMKERWRVPAGLHTHSAALPIEGQLP